MPLYTRDEVLEILTCCDNELHDGFDPMAKQYITVLDDGRVRVKLTPIDEDGNADESRAESFLSGPFVREEPTP